MTNTDPRAMVERHNLRILVTKCADVFVAQCLDYDISTQANDLETLRSRMDCLIEAELEDGQDIYPAPERFHKMWDAAALRVTQGGK